MKVLTYLIMLLFKNPFNDFGVFVLKGFEEYPKLELVVVMIIIPLFLNAFQFWVVDNFLKESDESRISRMAKGQKLLAQVRWEDYMKKTSNNNIGKSMKKGKSSNEIFNPRSSHPGFGKTMNNRTNVFNAFAVKSDELIEEPQQEDRLNNQENKKPIQRYNSDEVKNSVINKSKSSADNEDNLDSQV